MKVLHTAIMSAPMIGVLRQMEAEQESAKRLGFNWKSSYYLSQAIESPVVTRSTTDSANRLRFKVSYYKWLKKEAEKYDVILLRYSTFDPLQLFFLISCKKLVYSMHHTLEVPELYAVKSSKKGSTLGISLKLFVEKVFGVITLSMVDGVIGVTEEIRNYNMGRRLIKRSIPSYVYTNGIEFYSDARFKQRKKQDVKNTPPVLLFVSSVYDPWQGLEELIEDASSYEGEFICHVVGELNDSQMEIIGSDSRFVKHGRRDGGYIADLSAQSDIGLSILAAYKKNMDNIPALKVREYLKEGLAVYAGHGDALPQDYPYYRKGPIDIREIVDFAIQNRSNPREDISDSARQFFDKEVLVKKLHEFLIRSELDR